MTRDEYALRAEIIETCKAMNASGINQGTSGNVSVRWRDGLLITPSGLPYHQTSVADIVYMDMDGRYDHHFVPSVEWRFHRDILKHRPDMQAVVHAHPTYATAFAMCRTEIPAAHYMIAGSGGPTIRCADYATYGTEELSLNALKALEDRQCCLLANHGMIACGPSLGKALWLAVELETLCRQYAVALSIGKPVILSDAEIMLNVEKFKSYGPKPKVE